MDNKKDLLPFATHKLYGAKVLFALQLKQRAVSLVQWNNFDHISDWKWKGTKYVCVKVHKYFFQPS